MNKVLCAVLKRVILVFERGILMKVFVDLTTWIGYVGFLALMVFLVFFCLRTRSKGLVVLATAMGVRFLRWLILVVHAYMRPWKPGLDIRDAPLFRGLKLAIITGGIEVVLFYSLCLLGAFLVYKEWRNGKFNREGEK